VFQGERGGDPHCKFGGSPTWWAEKNRGGKEIGQKEVGRGGHYPKLGREEKNTQGTAGAFGGGTSWKNSILVTAKFFSGGT